MAHGKKKRKKPKPYSSGRYLEEMLALGSGENFNVIAFRALNKKYDFRRMMRHALLMHSRRLDNELLAFK